MDPQVVAKATHAAGQDEMNAKLTSDGGRRHVSVAIDKRRVAIDHQKRPESRQFGDDVFRDAIREVALVGFRSSLSKRSTATESLSDRLRCARASDCANHRHIRDRPLDVLEIRAPTIHEPSPQGLVHEV